MCYPLWLITQGSELLIRQVRSVPHVFCATVERLLDRWLDCQTRFNATGCLVGGLWVFGRRRALRARWFWGLMAPVTSVLQLAARHQRLVCLQTQSARPQPGPRAPPALATRPARAATPSMREWNAVRAATSATVNSDPVGSLRLSRARVQTARLDCSG